MTHGLVFNLQRFSTHDGPGIRTTVFLKGCPLRCLWCHNPESLHGCPEALFDDARCIACRACCEATGEAHAADLCPTGARRIAGEEMTLPHLMSEIRKDRVYFETSGGGVTFSGGEPLQQASFVQEALKACRQEGIHTALDTCGWAREEVLLETAVLADLVLYDLKGMDEERHQAATGVSNGPILANLKALAARHPHIWLRLPLVPGWTDGPESLEQTAALAASLPSVEKVCILPFHALGTHKTRLLGDAPAWIPPAAPDEEALARALEPFAHLHVPTHIGG